MNNPSIAEWCSFSLIAGIATYLTKPAIEWWLRRPWQLKGFPLRGAKAIVESVIPLPFPSGTNEPAVEKNHWHHFAINVTIKPSVRAITIPWMPSALRIMPAERWYDERLDYAGFDRYCRIESLELVCGIISFVPESGFAVVGPFDVRLRVAAQRDVRTIQFRYYLEQFGVISLPAPLSETMTANAMNQPPPAPTNGL